MHGWGDESRSDIQDEPRAKQAVLHSVGAVDDHACII